MDFVIFCLGRQEMWLCGSIKSNEVKELLADGMDTLPLLFW